MSKLSPRSACQTMRHHDYTHPDLRLPKFWRPKVTAVVKLDSKLAHWQMITAFVDGKADATTLQEWIDTGFAYSQMMHLLHADGTEFTGAAEHALVDQLEIYDAVATRYRTTGRVAFSGPELNIARAAALVMDELIQMDRHGIALKAAIWTTEQSARLTKRRRQGKL